MKKVFISILTATLMSGSVWAGGDIGGGGTLMKIKQVLKLTPGQIQRLQQTETDNEAFMQWINTLDHKKQQKVWQVIFQDQVLPQIDGEL